MSRWIVTVIVLLMVALMSSCDQQEVAETPPGYKVRQEDATVWATVDSTKPKGLLLLDGAVSEYFLVGERMVTTDESGQAFIWDTDCDGLYLYDDGGLKLTEYPEGGGTGSTATGTVTVDDCEISIRTMPADVETVGTWFSVTYLEELELVLVIVAEGTVSVTPATVLDYTLLDRDLLDYEVTTREMGASVEAGVGENDQPLFFYTAPDAQLEELKDLGMLPADRTWLALDELSPLRLLLSEPAPRLERWLEQIWQRGGLDSIPLPELLPLDQLEQAAVDEELSIVVAGASWDSELALDALAMAVSWRDLRLKLFDPGVALPLARLDEAAEPLAVRADLATVDYDPETAAALFAEIDFNVGGPLVLLVPADDVRLEAANWMAEELAAIGVETEILQIPAGEAREKMATMIQAGRSLLWFGPR